MSDQHNKAIMGCAGDSLIRTPNLDRLASEGMRFSNAYTNAPLCAPARMSFVTSKLPSHNQIWDNMQILTSGALTWPHQLPKAGYETALIGRMHFEGPDQRHGFEKRISAGPYAVHPGMHHSVAVYKQGVPEADGQNRAVMETTGGKGKGAYEVIDENVTASTCDYLRHKAENTNENAPFAVVAGYLLPHCPFIGDPDAFDYYYSKLPEAAVTQETLDGLPDGVRRYLLARELDTPLDPARVRSCQASYYAMVESMDRMIGQILDTLKQTGLDENTLVIYVSDHGEQLNAHGCWGKSCYYEGAVGVPMIARCPGLIQPGSLCSALVSLVDIGPTVLKFAGADALPHADGTSMLALMTDQSQGEDRSVISELYDYRGDVSSAMLRRGPWKLWQISDDSPDILFNLYSDPDEEQNVAEDPDCQDVLESLKTELRAVCDLDSTVARSRELNAEYARIAEWARYALPTLPETERVPVDSQSFEFV